MVPANQKWDDFCLPASAGGWGRSRNHTHPPPRAAGWGCSGDKAPETCCAPGSDQQLCLAGASLAPGAFSVSNIWSGTSRVCWFSVEKVAFVEFLLLFLASPPNPFLRWKLVISGFYCIFILFPSLICWFLPLGGLEDLAVPLTLSPGYGRLFEQPGVGVAARAPGFCSSPAQHHHPHALPTITTGINLHQLDSP